MNKIVLLAVAAAWAAVLIPPLLRNRMDNRPGSSVTDFRRQLSTLQRAVPTRSMTPMRIARPLAPSPLQRPAVQHWSATFGRTHGAPSAGQVTFPSSSGAGLHLVQHVDDDRYDRADRQDRYDRHDRYGYERGERQHHTGELQRRLPREHGHRQVHLPARHVSRRELVRRRRANVLFSLVALNVLTLFLAATTDAHGLLYVFFLAFVSLCGYVYKLAQLRQYEQDTRGHEPGWYHAA